LEHPHWQHSLSIEDEERVSVTRVASVTLGNPRDRSRANGPRSDPKQAVAERMDMRWFFGALLAAVIGFGVYIGSAVVSLSRLVEAARVGDGATVFERTDTARVRRSLVDQIVSAYLRQIGADRPVKPLERLAANTYGATIADAMIAKMLTEENLTRLLKTGTITSGDVSAANMLRLSELDTSTSFKLLSRLALVKPVSF
jgi:hypothetical protein